MAAMLIEIKSRMLLPRPPTVAAEEEDPRAELVRRLLVYEQMKLAARRIDELPQLGRDFMVAQVWVDKEAAQVLPEVNAEDLRQAWLWLLQRAAPARTEARFNKLQFISSSLYSLGHGGNDAQKTMGIITVLLYSQGVLQGDFHVPFWVVLSCQAAMGLGTLFGGWRIVHTMGSRITRLRPVSGFAAESAGAIVTGTRSCNSASAPAATMRPSAISDWSGDASRSSSHSSSTLR